MLLTTTFPPRGGSGVQRVYHQAELLTAAGHAVWVVTENDPELWVRDNSFPLRHLQQERITRVTVFPGPLGRLRRVVGKYVPCVSLYPDNHSCWKSGALEAAAKIITREKIEVVLVSLGSPSALEVAFNLKRQVPSLKLVVDVRDLWVGNPVRFLGRRQWQPFRDYRNRVNERLWLSEADAIVNVSRHHSETLRKRYPNICEDQFHIIQNGFDEEVFDRAVPLRNENDVLVIRYLGFLLPEMQGQVFFRALKYVVDNDPLNGAGIRCEFYGGNPLFIRQQAERAGVSKFVQANGYIEHEQAVSLMLGADVLLLFWTNDPGCMCGKFYEYLRAGRYILAFDQNNLDAREVLEGTSRGDWLAISDTAGHERKLRDLLETRRSGRPIQHGKLPSVADFSRQSQTNELARILATTTTS